MYRFLLPNGKALDYKAVLDAMSDFGSSDTVFLDILTGDVCIVSQKSNPSKLKDVRKKSDRYIQTPSISEENWLKWLGEFVKEMVAMEDVALAKKASITLEKKRLIETFKILEDKNRVWIDGWLEWSVSEVFDEFLSWLETLPVTIKEEFKGDDDCALCRALESDGNMSKEELMKLFKEEIKKKGNVESINMPNIPKVLPIITQGEIEKRITRLIKKYDLGKKLSFSIVKEWIYNDEGKSVIDSSRQYQTKWFKYFEKRFKGDGDINEALTIFTDAWNYLPHRSLDGMSPYEKYNEGV